MRPQQNTNKKEKKKRKYPSGAQKVKITVTKLMRQSQSNLKNLLCNNVVPHPWEHKHAKSSTQPVDEDSSDASETDFSSPEYANTEVISFVMTFTWFIKG
jgi:hypothetical protein